MKKILIGLLALTLNASAAYKIQTQGVKTSAECIAAGATDATCLIKDSQIYSSGLAGRLDQAITAGTLGSKLTTKGDLQTFSTANVRLPVGTNGQVLTADSGTATGLAWGDASGGGGSIENLIVNPTAELTSKAESATWTCMNATVAYDTGSYASPTRSWKITATSAGGYCESSVTTIAGRVNLDSYFYYKTTASDVTLGAYLGTNLQNSATLAAKSAMSGSSHVTFITDGTAQAAKIRVTMPTNGTVIYIDDLYAGANQNIGSVAQAISLGDLDFGIDCDGMVITSTSWQAPADGSCTKTVTDDSVISSTGDNYFGFTLPDTKKGKYEITLTGNYGYNAATDPGQTEICHAAWSTASSGGSIVTEDAGAIQIGDEQAANASTVWHITNPTQTTYYLNLKTQNGRTCRLECSTGGCRVNVKYFPTSSQTAVRVGTEAGFAKAFFNSNAYWSTTSTSPVFPTGRSGATFSVTNNGITLSSISDGTGIRPGGTITVDSAGWYNACWTSSINPLSNGYGAFAKLVLDDTTDVVKGASAQSGTTTPQAPLTLCGDFYLASSGAHTIKVYIWTTGGAGTRLSDAYGDDNESPTLSVKKLTQSIPQPVIVNSVTHSKANQKRIVHGVFSPSAHPTAPIITEVGTSDWSVSSTAVGKKSITFSPAFASTNFSCTCGVEAATYSGSSYEQCTVDTTAGKTSSTVQIGIKLNGAVSDALPVTFICIGDK